MPYTAGGNFVEAGGVMYETWCSSLLEFPAERERERRGVDNE